MSALRHIIITEVRSGIGFAVAREAVAKGYVVQGVGRGKKINSTKIRDRLVQEAQNNVGITFSENEGKDSFVVSGRGELMLEILLTQMRREGFEMTVSPPKVLYKTDESGNKLEPIEEITMDLDEEHSSKVLKLSKFLRQLPLRYLFFRYVQAY